MILAHALGSYYIFVARDILDPNDFPLFPYDTMKGVPVTRDAKMHDHENNVCGNFLLAWIKSVQKFTLLS